MNNVCCANRLENVLYNYSWTLQDSFIMFYVFSLFPLPVQSECVMADSNESTVTIKFSCTDKTTEEGFLLKMNYSIYLLKVNLDAGRK